MFLQDDLVVDLDLMLALREEMSWKHSVSVQGSQGQRKQHTITRRRGEIDGEGGVG